jgi:hypothetical protein
MHTCDFSYAKALGGSEAGAGKNASPYLKNK